MILNSAENDPQNPKPSKADLPDTANPADEISFRETATAHRTNLIFDAVLKNRKLVQIAGIYSFASALLSDEVDQAAADEHRVVVERFIHGTKDNEIELVEGNILPTWDVAFAVAETCRTISGKRPLGFDIALETLRMSMEWEDPLYLARSFGLLMRYEILPGPENEPKSKEETADLYRILQQALCNPFLPRLLDGVARSHYTAGAEIIDVIHNCFANTRDSRAYLTLMRMVTLPIRDDQRAHILTNLSNVHYEGLGELQNFLTEMASSTERTQALLPYISGLHKYTYDYWEWRTPYVYEQGLRVAKQFDAKLDEIRESLAPKIPRGVFLHALGLTEGLKGALSRLNMCFHALERFKTEDPVATRTLRGSLERLLTNCALLPVNSRIALADNLRDMINASGYSADTLPFACIQEISTGLSQAIFYQRVETPAIAMSRLIVSEASDKLKERQSQVEHFKQKYPFLVQSLTETFPGTPSDVLLDLLISLPPVSQLGATVMTIAQAQLTQWESGFNQPFPGLISDFKRYGVNSTSWSEWPAYLRALTIPGAPAEWLEYASELIVAASSPEGSSAWKKRRYDADHPAVKRTFSGLHPDLVERWQREHVSFFLNISMVNNEIRIIPCAFFITDNPYFLFHSGELPLGAYPCTSYDGGAYYSKNLLSYFGDAHIKAAFAIDLYQFCSELPEASLESVAEKIEAGTIEVDDLIKNTDPALHSIFDRTIIKLGRDQKSNHVLLLQPVITRDIGKVVMTSAIEAGLAKFQQIMPLELFHTQRLGALETLSVPPSRSPAGQIENLDEAAWAASYHGEYQVLAQRFQPIDRSLPYENLARKLQQNPLQTNPSNNAP